MTFQFLCPQGHLLQGEEAHMGMQCQCPQCGTAFIIPTIERPAEPSVGQQAAPDLDLAPLEEPDPMGSVGAPATKSGHKFPPARSPQEHFAGDSGAESFSSPDPEFDEGIEEFSDEVAETLLHIPCPNGHVLDVPLDMIGARAMCPHCRAEFRLRREKSEEYVREQEILDAKRAQFWFKLAIIAAGVVVVVLLVMILATALT